MIFIFKQRRHLEREREKIWIFNKFCDPTWLIPGTNPLLLQLSTFLILSDTSLMLVSYKQENPLKNNNNNNIILS